MWVHAAHEDAYQRKARNYCRPREIVQSPIWHEDAPICSCPFVKRSRYCARSSISMGVGPQGIRGKAPDRRAQASTRRSARFVSRVAAKVQRQHGSHMPSSFCSDRQMKFVEPRLREERRPSSYCLNFGLMFSIESTEHVRIGDDS
jgi:hypothetical protein